MFSRLRPECGFSLRAQLTTAFAAAFGVCLALVFLGVDGWLSRAATQQVDDWLAAEAGRLADLGSRRKEQIVAKEMQRSAAHHGEEVVLLQLLAPTGALLASSATNVWGGCGGLPPAGAAAAGQPRFLTTVLPGGRRVRRACLADAAGRVVHAARTLEPLDLALRGYRRAAAVSFAVSFCAGTLLAGYIAGRVTARLERLRATAERIAAGNLGERVPEGGAPDEIHRLTVTFNSMLERLNTALQELRLVSDSLAHDVRSPLARMRAAAEAAVTDTDPAEARAACALVVEECDRLERMTSTMLQIARLESGIHPLAGEPVDLRALAAGAVELYAPACEDRHIALIADAGGDAPALRVRGEKALLERALANLVDNALAHTPSNGHITIACRRAGAWAELSVQDTGRGLAPEILPHVFERGFRGDPSRGHEHAGLGLSLVQAVAAAHGGDVRAFSPPGQGARLCLRLPVAPDPAA